MTDATELKARAVEEWLVGSQDWIISELKRIIQAPSFDPERIRTDVEELGVHTTRIELKPQVHFDPRCKIEFQFLIERDDESLEIQVNTIMNNKRLAITNMHLNRSIRF